MTRLGTVLFAVIVGYFMQRSLRLFRYQHGPVAPVASPAD